ncbi:MAG: GAF domain-containing protein [Candidatus Schekmanbacteria bacterium]|nr:GAF domain-containing protein [Candidatus Schekmanbacteria bacterium]
MDELLDRLDNLSRPNDVIAEIVRALHEDCGYTHVSFFLVGDDDYLGLANSRGIPQAVSRRARIRASDPFVLALRRAKRTITVSKLLADPRWGVSTTMAELLRELEIDVCVPVKVAEEGTAGTRLLGVLNLSTSPGGAEDHDRSWLLLLAAAAGERLEELRRSGETTPEAPPATMVDTTPRPIPPFVLAELDADEAIFAEDEARPAAPRGPTPPPPTDSSQEALDHLEPLAVSNFLLVRAREMLARNRLQEAESCIMAYLDADPDNPEARELSREIVRQRVARAREDADDWLVRPREYLRQRMYQEAIDELQIVLRSHPDLPDARRLLSQANSLLSEELRKVEAAQREQARNVATAMSTAEELHRRGQYEESRAALRQVFQAVPQHAQARELLARLDEIQARQRQRQLADPAGYHRERAERLQHEGKLREALSELRTALRHDPANALILRAVDVLSKQLLEQEFLEKKQEERERALRIKQLLKEGKRLLKTNELDACAAALRKVLFLDPTNSTAEKLLTKARYNASRR